MKINYQQTVDKAKEMNLITETDKYVFCTVRPKDGRNMGIMQEVIYYKYDILFVINQNEVKLIDVDKKTGTLVGSYKIISRENIIDLNDYWSLLSRDFYIKSDGFSKPSQINLKYRITCIRMCFVELVTHRNDIVYR